MAMAMMITALVLIPLVLAPDRISALSQMLIAALFALAFSLLMGQGGMLSFGHAAYLAVGCFATIHAMQAVEKGVLNIPTPLLPLVGGLAGLLVGMFAGYFATLRSGTYFSMVTLAIAELFHSLAPNLQGVFGGEGGVSSMRQPWAGITFGREIEVYYLVLVWAVLGGLAMFLYTRTSFGRLTVALRENERRVAFLGFDVHMTKLMVFSVSSMFAGVAGGLLAITNESANYMLFNLSYSADVVLYSYIGGVKPFLGPALGASVMTLFGNVTSDMTRIWLLYQGLIFVLVMMYAPTGMVSFLQTIAGQIKQRTGPSFAMRVCILVMMLVIAVSTVFLFEMISVVFSRDYQALLQRNGTAVPVVLFRHEWSAISVSTWAVPIGAICAAIFGLYYTTRQKLLCVTADTLQEAQT